MAQRTNQARLGLEVLEARDMPSGVVLAPIVTTAAVTTAATATTLSPWTPRVTSG